MSGDLPTLASLEGRLEERKDGRPTRKRKIPQHRRETWADCLDDDGKVIKVWITKEGTVRKDIEAVQDELEAQGVYFSQAGQEDELTDEELRARCVQLNVDPVVLTTRQSLEDAVVEAEDLRDECKALGIKRYKKMSPQEMRVALQAFDKHDSDVDGDEDGDDVYEDGEMDEHELMEYCRDLGIEVKTKDPVTKKSRYLTKEEMQQAIAAIDDMTDSDEVEDEEDDDEESPEEEDYPEEDDGDEDYSN